jgi:inner membrane transporter RhtA
MMKKFAPILVLVVAMFSIQYGASLAKELFPYAGPAGAVTLRLFFSSVILFFIFRPWRVRFDRSLVKNLAVYGVSLGLMNLSFYFALERIPLGIAVAVEFLGPLTLAIILSKKKIDYLWALLAGLGLYLLLPFHEASNVDPVGLFFAALAGFFWALYILFGKKAGTTIPGGVTTSLGMLFATVAVLPFGLTLSHSEVLSEEALLLGLGVGVLGSAIPYSLEMIALKKIEAKTFGILMSLEPAVASPWVSFFFQRILQCFSGPPSFVSSHLRWGAQ